MGRGINRLTAREIDAASTPRRYADGGGLYLNIAKGGTKTWMYIYRSPTYRIDCNGKQVGKTREMGLGSIATIKLAAARDRAQQLRQILAAGRDPLDAPAQEIEKQERVPTFGALADELIASLEVGWRNPKHRAQWKMTMQFYAAPLRALPASDINTDDVLSVLRPIWQSKPETASRVRGRIEKVLDYAKARKFRQGENPAAWRGNLALMLPKLKTLTRVDTTLQCLPNKSPPSSKGSECRAQYRHLRLNSSS